MGMAVFTEPPRSKKLGVLCIFKLPSEMLWCVISTVAACSESLCSDNFSSHQLLHLMPGASVLGCPVPGAAWGHHSLGLLGGGHPPPSFLRLGVSPLPGAEEPDVP